jgi:hypothetical protein
MTIDTMEVNQKAGEIRTVRETTFLPDDPNRIGLIIEEIYRRASNIKREMLEIGRLLTEAKEIVGHGNFKKWIEEIFDFSYQTANNLMNVYRYCGGRPEIITTVKASVLYQISAPKFPKDLREHLFEHSQSLEDIGNERMRKICEQYKKKEIGLDSPEVKELFRDLEKEVELSRYEKALEDWFASFRAFLDRLQAFAKTGVAECPAINGKVRLTQERADELELLFKGVERIIGGLKPKYDVEKGAKI